MRIWIALAGGLALIAAVLLMVLSRAPLVVGRVNTTASESVLQTITGRALLCQEHELVPRGTTAVHLSLRTNTLGAPINVKLLSGTRLLSEGNKEAGWRARGVTVPIRRVANTVPDVTICATTGHLAERLMIRGVRTSRAVGVSAEGTRLAGRLKILYLRRGSESWWSMALAVARRMGLGHFAPGAWIALLLAIFMGANAGLAAWLIVRELGNTHGQGEHVQSEHVQSKHPKSEYRRRLGGLYVPALACMMIAFLNAACWSFLSPPFQVDDEQDHFAYVQQLAENGRLPAEAQTKLYSQEEETALVDLDYFEVRSDTETRTIGARAEQQRLERDLASDPSRHGNGDVGVANAEPPLYYALEVIPYALGSSGTILTRLELMRLLSALMAAVSALFVVLFLRESLPATPWAWSVGGLAAALNPLLGVMSGSVNPDALLCAISAACFYCLARGFRHGLTRRLAIAILALTAVGLLTKLTFTGLVPGIIIGVMVLAGRLARVSKGAAARRFALVVSPTLAYAVLAILKRAGDIHSGIGRVSTNPVPHGSWWEAISYTWQSYLPPLPGMSRIFPEISTWHDVWFNGLVGLYGWDDIAFPDAVNRWALIPAAAALVLCVHSLIQSRSTTRAHFAEVVTYSAIVVGVLALLGAASYGSYPEVAMVFRLPRYLLPLLALGGMGAALVARGAGRRWGPVVGALLVLLVLAHDLFSQLLVISRYYS